jgi:hypothetical protein
MDSEPPIAARLVNGRYPEEQPFAAALVSDQNADEAAITPGGLLVLCRGA